ncbi:hypothetical protein BV25DRAFT_1880490 [Artomyces pyxidatus]|uniref:Uncharacterized protein n=1 Tax=Artomyces pyxidatus TaxID=48021 RepID=A0ACB8TAT9_9AGAM|nr:hypothetical protein BV25DRAFT_1880490 [Artomyces pyxidatus]
MSRLPPALLYLTIYNPDLKPTVEIADDDEDAEEQAHILFYTARERAASRDRMLRQIGLAKALINFADMFSPDDVCDNVHSQSRRMLMVSPEPGFWIHACLELAKSPSQAVPSRGKGKQRGKEKEKDKAKDNEGDPGYDYHDGSVHDMSVRAQLLRGYEEFKLLHGSFASILRDLGQQALELQLERFFTVWAWRWDIEQDSDFGRYLGIPLHPLHKSMTPIVDRFNSQLSSDAASFVLVPPHIIPSTSYMESIVPPELPLHLLSRIPPPRPAHTTERPPQDLPPTAAPTDVPKPTVDRFASSMAVTKDAMEATGNAFIAIGTSMDVRKWGWPGYLTFGKGNRRPGSMSSTDEDQTEKEPPVEEGVTGNDSQHSADRVEGDIRVHVDTESLHDAMSSSGLSVAGPLDAGREDATSHSVQGTDEDARPTDAHEATFKPNGDNSHETVPSLDVELPTAPFASDDDEHERPHASTSTDLPAQEDTYSTSPTDTTPSIIVSPPRVSPSPSQRTLPAPLPAPTFSSIPIHLAPPNDPSATVRRCLLYRIQDQLAVAFLAPEQSNPDGETTASYEAASALLANLSALIAEDQASRSSELPLYSATKILQPKDKYIFTTGRGLTASSPEFVSRSEHLYNGQQLISSTDALEVFSRTQGPQHWHIARREQTGAVYMEVSRKETSLTDVDNELAGLVRRLRDGEQR